MKKNMSSKGDQIQYESMESGTFTEEQVDIILEDLAALLISFWYKNRNTIQSNHQEDDIST
jgi:hypothetical protein